MSIQVCRASLESITPYTQSRKHDAPKKDREGPDAYEERTWKLKAHTDDNGIVFIPAMAFKMTVDSAARFLSIQIPGKGKSTYTKHFVSGVMVTDNLSTGVHIDDVRRLAIQANSDGVRGSGKRVKRFLPQILAWAGEIDFYLFDATITPKIFEEVLAASGKFIGIGQYRPENGGTNGRFAVRSVAWREE